MVKSKLMGDRYKSGLVSIFCRRLHCVINFVIIMKISKTKGLFTSALIIKILFLTYHRVEVEPGFSDKMFKCTCWSSNEMNTRGEDGWAGVCRDTVMCCNSRRPPVTVPEDEIRQRDAAAGECPVSCGDGETDHAVVFSSTHSVLSKRFPQFPLPF